MQICWSTNASDIYSMHGPNKQIHWLKGHSYVENLLPNIFVSIVNIKYSMVIFWFNINV